MLTNRFIYSFLVTALLFGLQACAQNQQFLAIGEKNIAPQASKKSELIHNKQVFTTFDLVTAAENSELVLQQGDVLRVSIWGYPGLEHIAEVQPNGSISLPLAGEIQSSGLTLPELQKSITKHLAPFTIASDLSLRQGDSLTLSVWQNPDLTHKAIVEPSGNITFPLVGSVKASGRPLKKITDEVKKKLNFHLRDAEVTLLPEFSTRRTLKDFHVSVLTQNLKKRQIAIIGAVGLQGIQSFKGSLRISDALAQAQLQKQMASLNSIIVIRNPEDKRPQYRRILMEDYFNGLAPNQNIYLRNEDIIIVPKTQIAIAGDYIEQFFSRTLPIFQWWSSLHAASSAKESVRTVDLINQSLEQGLLNITPSN
jgi:polysaccharide export outer membrane protein